MSDIFNNSKYMYDLYFSNGIYLALYVISLVYLIVFEKNKQIRRIFLGQVVLFSFIYWCPITAYIIAEYCIGREVYWRMFWMLPVTMLIAFAMTRVIQASKEKIGRFFVFVILVYLVWNFGTTIYKSPEFVESTNPYKISQNVIEVCDVVKEHAEENNIGDYGIIVPNELVPEIRQYDGLMRMPYGRDMLRGMDIYGLPKAIFTCLNAPLLDTNLLADLALSGNYQYLAYNAAADKNEFLRVGYTFVQEAGAYNVYYHDDENAIASWEITQYGSRDINSNFYTIYSPDEGLIVIDGGWTEDAEYVREVINSYGGKVKAWILTHAHQDHIGAFTALYSNLNGIEIENIYTVDMASPEDCMSVAPWDSVDAYNEFLALNIPNLQYVYTGEVLEVCGLKIEILSTFNEDLRAFSGDYLNDGSMMFKVYGNEDSFLFCADVGISMSDYLLNKWGAEKFASDYLQMGHHGFGGLSDAFYQAVNPKIAFFDAPNWLMYDETGRYDAPENIALMESLGSQIKGFNSAPNKIILY